LIDGQIITSVATRILFKLRIAFHIYRIASLRPINLRSRRIEFVPLMSKVLKSITGIW